MQEFGINSTAAAKSCGGTVAVWSLRIVRLTELGLLSLIESNTGRLNRYKLTTAAQDALRAAD